MMNPTVNDSAKVSPLHRIPPPLLFLVPFLVGVGLQRIAPMTALSARNTQGLHAVGFVLAGCAALLALYSIGIFLVARTTIIPFGAASKLVSWGPYRISRNPMYVSLVLLYVGLAMMLVQLWALILIPLPVIFLQRIIIPLEEKRMREVFGEAYRHYCSKVRRWL